MPTNNEAVNEAIRKIGETLTQLKKMMEELAEMRVECAKLEFNMLSLYHTVCPTELEHLCDDERQDDSMDVANSATEENDAR